MSLGNLDHCSGLQTSFPLASRETLFLPSRMIYTNIVFVRVIHIVVCSLGLFILIAVYYSIYENITQLIFMHLTADGHLDDLQYGVIMNSVALNMLAHIPVNK